MASQVSRRRDNFLRGSFFACLSMAIASVGICCAATGAAQPDDTTTRDMGAMNGVFHVTENGEWAKTNEVYHDEAVVQSTWTVTSSCVNPLDCHGKVHSDQGWSADISNTSGLWFLKRDLPAWYACPDGSPVPAQQVLRFYPAGNEGFMTVGSPTWAGESITTGLTGACGVNRSVVVRMPLTLVRIS
ncbi:MAG: hypothetical protein AB1925_04620 [Actinomycetota bacterium]